MADFELDAKLEAKEEPQENPPRRYEIIDAQTGEKVEGTSFVLAPTGNQMHMLAGEGFWVGPAYFGYFYWLSEGSTEEDWPGAQPQGKEIAIRWATEYFMSSRMLALLENNDLERLKESVEKRIEKNAKE